MATLTVQEIPDEQVQQLKEVAEKSNRSMESQVRSILEEWLAGTVAHEITRRTNFYDEIREFMRNLDFEGLDKGEFPLSEWNSAGSRPPISFEQESAVIILSINVINEIIKKQSDEHVANWLRNQNTSNLATTAITVVELLAEIRRIPEGKRRKYADTTIKLAPMTSEDRTFAFGTQAAADYAHILAEREHRGTPTSIRGTMIAAIAYSWGAAITTRNIRDLEGTDVELINSWEFAQREALANCRGLVNITISPAALIVRRV